MKNIDIKDLFTKEGKDKEKLDLRPQSFWTKTVSVFLLLILIFLSLGLFFFYQILHDRIFVVEVNRDDPLEVVEEEQIEQAILQINSKAERFEQLQTERSDIIDPAP